MAGVLAHARESRQAVGGRRADQAALAPGAHPYEDARDVELRHERLLELRVAMAAGQRLLHPARHQASHLAGDERSRYRDVEQFHGLYRVPAAAAGCAEPVESAIGYPERSIEHDTRLDCRSVRRQLRHLRWDLVV